MKESETRRYTGQFVDDLSHLTATRDIDNVEAIAELWVVPLDACLDGGAEGVGVSCLRVGRVVRGEVAVEHHDQKSSVRGAIVRRQRGRI